MTGTLSSPLARAWAYGVPVVIAYLLMVGATPLGELYVGFRVLNALIGAALLIVYLLRAPSVADRLDKLTLGVLVAFGLLSVLSTFPRQSFDAMLSMSAYAAGLFLARDVLRDMRTRRLVKGTMRVLSVVVLGLLVVEQIQPVLMWLDVIGWDPPPPTGMPFNGLQWGNRYDVVLLAVMLFPAWLTGAVNRARVISIGAAALILGVIVLNAGSRNIWAAVAGATVTVVALHLGRHRWSIRPAALAAVAGTVVVSVIAIMAIEPLRERLLTPQTIGQRYAMWSSIVQAWTDRPLVGYGPGSFPWVLQLTRYFDANTIAPRHPDSAIFQLLAEGGVVGILAAATLLIGLGSALAKRGPLVAVWPLAFFAFAGLNSNPTDFGFLVITAIIWLAIALPREATSLATGRQGHAPVKVARLAGATIVLVAYVLTIVAGARYETAMMAASRSDFAIARISLESAASLDPGMALYWRQAGTAAFLQGDIGAAKRLLGAALRINPLDDLAWRAMALAEETSGDGPAALRAVDRAVAVQRSDATNLLLSFALRERLGRTVSTDEVAEVQLAWPTLLAAPGWAELLPDGLDADVAIGAAIDRWREGGSTPAPLAGEPLLLTIVAGRPDLVEAALATAGSPLAFAGPASKMAACDPGAPAALAAMPVSARQDATFWLLAAPLGGIGSIDETGARRLLGAMTGRRLPQQLGSTFLNPLHENNSGGYSADAWGYRRLPIAWPPPSIVLPSRVAGEANLLYRWSDFTCR